MAIVGWRRALAAGVSLLMAIMAIALLGVARTPLWSVSPLPRARVAYARGDWHTASTLALERLAQDAHDQNALRLLARSSARLGRDGAAQDLYLRLGAQGAQAEDYYLLSTTLVRQHRDDQAMRMLERAQRADPNHPETLQALVELYSKNDFRLTATGVARRLVSQPGWEARGYWALGRLFQDNYDPVGASAAFAQVLRYDSSARTITTSPSAVRKRLARALLRTERPAEAEAQLQAILASEPDQEAFWLLSRARLQKGALSGANEALEQAGKYADDNLLAAEPAPYVGAARCATCHGEIHSAEQSSRHSRSFARALDMEKFPLPDQPIADPSNPRVIHNLARTGGRIEIETTVNGTVIRAQVEYALGSGGRAVTLVVRDDAGEYREYRLSRYAHEVGWDLTVHHPKIPEKARDFLGKPIGIDRVPTCLNCHVTDYRAALDRTGPEAADHGIGCERCHGPGGNHLRAVDTRFSDMAIIQPQLASAAERVALCTQCHDATPGATPADPEFVRFQGPNILKSRCYTKSGGSFDCMTCHNPHRSVETAASFYEAKCLDCHGSPATRTEAARSASRDDERKQIPCPVNTARDCLQCHMPKVKDPVPHTSFTDHYIRVHR